MCVVRCVNSERNIKGEGTPVGFPDKFLSFPSAVAATLERALSALLAQCLFRAVHSLLLPNDTMAASDFTSRQTEALLASAQAFASLSFLGSLFIIFCWCRYHHLRKLSFTLVLWLAVADIGADITYFMGNPGDPDPNNPTCIAQGSLQQFFQMAQILWTVAIAWALREVTVNLRMYHEGEQKAVMRRFHLFVWGFSLLSMLLPFTTNSYGSAGPWCWIEMYPNNLGTMWRYLVLYVPIWAAIIYNIRVYVRILGVVRRFSAGVDDGAPEGATAGPSSDQQTRMAKFMQRLMWYPAVLIISWTFATINRIYNTFHPSESIFGLFFMHQMMVNLQGLMNAIVYGSTDAIRTAVLKERCLDCRRGTSDGNDGLDPEDDHNEGTGVGMRDMRSNRFADNFGVKISESSQSTSGVSNSLEDVEVYNPADYTVTV